MANIDINTIEKVEGEYHLMFLEGKKLVESSKNDMRYAFFAFLLFVSLVLVFVLISGFNLFLVGFLLVYLIVFVAMVVYSLIQKHKGKKKCIYAVQNSNANDIVSKQVDTRGKIVSDRRVRKQKRRRRVHIARLLSQKQKEDNKNEEK